MNNIARVVRAGYIPFLMIDALPTWFVESRFLFEGYVLASLVFMRLWKTWSRKQLRIMGVPDLW